MMTLRSIFKKTGIIALCLTLGSFYSNATVFTAVLSGNFSASATWGGLVPPILVSTDAIIIPSGVTVTLDGDQSFSGTASLLINGTLTSGTYTSALSLIGGTVSGTGAIQVDSLVLNMTTGISYTGSIVAQSLTSLGASITAATNITVNNSLNLAGGAMNIAAGSLTMGAGSTINVNGGTLMSSGIGTITLSNPYSLVYMGGSATSGVELTGLGLGALTVNTTGAITMSTNATVHGLMTLTAGTLALNGYNLILGTGADVSASGTGTLSGTLASNVTLATSGSLAGALRFATGGSVINNLTVNMAAAGDTASLGSNLTINGALSLTSGKLMLGANNLMINAGGTVSGGSSASFVITNGTGALMMNLAAGASDTFNVGTKVSYAPIVVAAASSSATGNVGVNLAGLVYSGGTGGSVISATNSMVDATWFVSSDATAAINYSMTAMWNSSMEVNGFDRTNAYISHYTGGAWDVQTPQPSTSIGGSMYSMTRTGITSLSPFRVADRNSNPTFVPTLAQSSNVTVYPNPTSNVINFNAPSKIDAVSIYNVLGQLVKSSDAPGNSLSVAELPSGMYYAHLTSGGTNTVAKFSKQ